jgi:hypothetical protein
MTTTANKFGLKKAAQERSNRHAQKTPLPPRAGSVDEATEPVEGQPYGKMTAPELRKVLNGMGFFPAKGLDRGRLLELILNVEMKAAKADLAAAEKQLPRKVKASVSDATLDASKSFAKASDVMSVGMKHGWDMTPERLEGDTVELLMKRGDEVLWISWTAGVLTTEPMPSYTVADRTIKLRNASAVKQYAAREPETGKKELVKVQSNRFFRKRAIEPTRAKLPFDPKLATDEEVIARLSGKAIAWHNSRTQGTEQANVGLRWLELREVEDGDRIFSFCGPGTGFRACRLSAITSVSGAMKRMRRPRATVEVEEGSDDE